MPSKKKDDKKRKTGPDPETVKTDKPWEESVSDALKKERPKEGWPKESDTENNPKMDRSKCAKCGKPIRPAKDAEIKFQDGIPYTHCPHCLAKNRLRDVIGSLPSGPRYFEVDGLLDK